MSQQGVNMETTFTPDEQRLIDAWEEHLRCEFEDRDAAALIEQALIRDGVNLNCCSKLLRARREGEEKVLEMELGSAHEELRFDEILVGVGRAPNVASLSLEEAGVEYDRQKGVKVNDRLQTSNPRVYAAGDICSAYKFTHTADAAARIVIQNALFLGRSKASALTIPWCTFTDPEIAHVGLYAHQAEEKGIPAETVMIP